MQIRRTLAYAALATSIVACIDDIDPDQPDGDGGVEQPGKPGQGDAGNDDGVSVVLRQPSRGAAVALSDDEQVAVVVNRDTGSASVLAVKYEEGKTTRTEQTYELELGDGSEPWQVVIAPDNETAFVVLRRDQKLVRLSKLSTKPEVSGSVSVGSEPTSLALSPSGRRAYVANWTDGTVSVLDTASLALVDTIDLNPALVKTGYLGDVKARPALAHPRSITVTNDGDLEDYDESLLITEYFAQQVAALQADGLNADVNKAGIVYKVPTADYKDVSTINLAALENIGFKDANGNFAGCYPNQLQSITVNGNYAYVTSVCAAPEGPEGLKLTTKACQSVTDCQGDDLKLVDPVCDVAAFGKGKVCQDNAGFKTATSPVVSVIDVKNGKEVPNAAQNLNARFDAFFKETNVTNKRFPLFMNDLAFVPETGVAYVTGNGIDTVFRLVFDPATGTLEEVGASTAPFIPLAPAGIKPEDAGKGPIGLAIGAANKKFSIVANNITRNAHVLDFNTQAIAGGVAEPSVTQTTALPAKGSDEEKVLLGKDLFNTGRARWSLNGEGWGACQSCHSDGLTDNVSWFFGRGPRQSTSLDGSFASKDPSDQRIFNHTATRDEFADFEINTRNTSGGAGAIVLAKSVPPVFLDRIDIQALKLAELDGSSLDASDPANPLGLGFNAVTGQVVVGQKFIDPNSMAAGGLLDDWLNITRYAQTIRTPRAPSNLKPELVEAGEKLFTKYGSCQGCHGGAKWTVSKLFYKPGVEVTAALKVSTFAVPAGFPSALLPAQDPQDFKLVINAGGESVQCVERNVGTFNVAEPGIGIAELRGTNMKDVAQGGGVALRPNADGDNDPTNDPKAGIGYNVPSLLGAATAAPYLHAGNARTLEALLQDTFQKHHRALAPNFLQETDPALVQGQIDELVQYLLSIDEDKPTVDLPKVAGASGGALCPETFTTPAK